MGPGLGARRGTPQGPIPLAISVLQWGRAWEPGGAAADRWFKAMDLWLQWGRAWEPGGAGGVVERRSAVRMLQWGRAWEPGGAARPGRFPRRRPGASMGPGLGARRGRSKAPVPLAPSSCFNGAGLGSPEGPATRPASCSSPRCFNGAGLGSPEGPRQRRVRRGPGRPDASMGPGLGARRGLVRLVKSAPNSVKLQWGRAWEPGGASWAPMQRRD